MQKLFDYNQDKSSPDSASDYKSSNFETKSSSHAFELACGNSSLVSKCISVHEDVAKCCCYRRTLRAGMYMCIPRLCLKKRTLILL